MTMKTTMPELDRFQTHAEAERQALALVNERQRAVTAADRAEGELRERIRRGDDSVTALDLLLAQVEAGTGGHEGLADLRLEAAQKALTRLQQRRPGDPRLAEAIRDAIAETLGVPVSVTEDAPTWPSEPAEPQVVLRALNGSELSGNGAYRGSVEVSYLRGRLHAPLPISDLARVLTRADQVLKDDPRMTGSAPRGEWFVDRAVFEFVAAYPKLPIVADEIDGGASGVCRNGAMSTSAASRVAARIWRLLPKPGDIAWRVESLRVSGSSRSIVVKVVVGGGDARRVVPSLSGAAIAGLGRCTKVVPGRDYDWLLTFESAVAA